MKISENRSKLAALAAAALVAAGLAVVAGGFTWQAVASPPSGGGSAGSSSNAFAVGAFTAMNGDHFAFAAQKNPTTNALQGGYVVQNVATGGTRSGKVTCLNVGSSTMSSTNGKATIQWTVAHSTVSSSEVGQTRELDVTDLGEPNGVTPGPDEYTDDGDCSMTMCNGCTNSPEGGMMLVVNGNIVVKGP
jgi:hypothetical protein